MCPGVESDKPGACPKCGMALELNPAWKPAAKTIYTCPMHPEIEQDHPGTCPKCGMALEAKTCKRRMKSEALSVSRLLRIDNRTLFNDDNVIDLLIPMKGSSF